MENVISQLIDNFNFAYMLIINIMTYMIIHIIDDINGDKVCSMWTKRIVFIAVAIVITLFYVLMGYKEYVTLLNSFCVAPVAWSWVFKPILTKFGLDYKKDS